MSIIETRTNQMITEVNDQRAKANSVLARARADGFLPPLKPSDPLITRSLGYAADSTDQTERSRINMLCRGLNPPMYKASEADALRLNRVFPGMMIQPGDYIREKSDGSVEHRCTTAIPLDHHFADGHLS